MLALIAGVATGFVFNDLVSMGVWFAPWEFSAVGLPFVAAVFLRLDGRAAVVFAVWFLVGCLGVFRFGAPFFYLKGLVVSVAWLGSLNGAILALFLGVIFGVRFLTSRQAHR